MDDPLPHRGLLARGGKDGIHGAQDTGLRRGAPTVTGDSFRERVFAMVREVPEGRVVSYGAVAALLGVPRAARGVGRALSTLPPDTDVPWWRVVNRNGEISIKGAPGLPALQRTLLAAEGVRPGRGGRISWTRFGWRGPDGDD